MNVSVKQAYFSGSAHLFESVGCYPHSGPGTQTQTLADSSFP